MKNLYRYILLVLIPYMALCQQTSFQTTLTPTAYKVVYVYYGGTSFQYYSANYNSIGHQHFSNPYEVDRWRTMYKFDMSSIPSGAIVVGASLKTWVTNYDGTNNGEVYYMATTHLLAASTEPNQLTYEQIFSGAISGTRKARHKYTDTVNTTITNDIKSRFSTGKAVFGGFSSIESYNTSRADLHLELTVTYETDSSKVNYDVIVRNSINGGSLVVDGDTVDSGTSFNWRIGSWHTLNAYTQEYAGKIYPLKLNDMWKNITTNETYNQNPFPLFVTDNATYEAQFDLPMFDVTVDQKLSDNATRVGTIGRWNGSSFPTPRLNPGDQISVTQGTSEVMQGDQQILSGEKYNNWNTLPDVSNHHVFAIQPSTDRLVSNFASTNNVTIQAQLIDGGSLGGNIDFKDPWLIDYADPNYGGAMRNRGMDGALWYTKTSPFTPNTNPSGSGSEYKGVFLNQNEFFESDKPIYTIRAPQPQNFNGVESYFFKWSCSNAAVQNAFNPETPIVFQSANATATALYKAHLASNNPTPTKGNGQQRIATLEHNWYYYPDPIASYWENVVVYESAGEIWTTSYNYDTDTWYPEILLSDGSGCNSEPSIAARGKCFTYDEFYGDGLYVVWQKQNPDNTYDVYFALRNSYTGQVEWITTHPTLGSPLKVNTSPCIVPPKPVASIYRNTVRGVEIISIAWRQDAGTINRRYTDVNKGGYDGFLSLITPLSASSSPSLPPGEEGLAFCLSQPSMINNYTIDTITLAYAAFAYPCSFNLWTINSIIDAYPVWLTPEKVPASDDIALDGLSFSPSSWYGDFYETKNIYCPQVIRRCGKTCYAWIEHQVYDSPDVPFVVYQERSSSGVWSNAIVWDLLYLPNWNLLPSSVSLGNYYAYAWQEDITGLIWSVGNTTYKAERINSDPWQTTTLLTDGYDAQITYSGYGTSELPPWSDPYYYLYTEPGPSLQSIRTRNDWTPLEKSALTKTSGTGPIANRPFPGSGRGSMAQGTPVNCRYSRILTIADTVQGSRLSITVSQPKVGNRSLEFNPVNDTLPDINAENCLEYLSSLPVIIGNTDDTLSFNIGIRYKSQQGREKKAMQPLVCDLKNAITSSKIASLASLTVDTKKGSNRYHIKVPVKNYKGASLKTALSGIDLNKLGKNLQFLLIHVYKPEASDTTAIEKMITETNQVPTEFGLQQNYPNPFNPSTVISYQLPNVGVQYIVSLKVYDVLGREVATLTDGMKEAGYYTANFDASMLSSGIYFARLIAQPTGGTQPFVQVRKMLLTK